MRREAARANGASAITVALGDRIDAGRLWAMASSPAHSAHAPDSEELPAAHTAVRPAIPSA